MTHGIREFMSRDWDAARAAKDRYWADRVARLGPIEGLRIADELRRQARCDPSWPRPDDRDADLASHVRLAALFRRVDTARSA
jgi:hypothetical protein